MKQIKIIHAYRCDGCGQLRTVEISGLMILEPSPPKGWISVPDEEFEIQPKAWFCGNECWQMAMNEAAHGS